MIYKSIPISKLDERVQIFIKEGSQIKKNI